VAVCIGLGGGGRRHGVSFLRGSERAAGPEPDVDSFPRGDHSWGPGGFPPE
jgi:hypothetical protein